MSAQTYAIRKLSPQDEPFLYEMLCLAIFVPPGCERPPDDVVQQPELNKYVRGFGRLQGDMGYVAVEERSERRLGAAWLRLLTTHNRGYGTINDVTPELTMAVAPAARGAGVGSALLERLLAAAREHYTAVSLSVWRANPAYRLYRRFGFELVEQDGPAVTLVKRLGSRR